MSRVVSDREVSIFRGTLLVDGSDEPIVLHGDDVQVWPDQHLTREVARLGLWRLTSWHAACL